jgi:mono/diheme cytochrome c family protein
MKKILKRLLVGIVLVVAILVSYVLLSWDKTFEAPLPDITASTDSAMIAHGKHLVYGPGHCGVCHVPMADISKAENGEHLPLVGGWELTIPPGTFRAPNITPDEETGIGKMTDGELARVLRHSVKPDGKLMVPFMPFQNMSDYDITSIISFLRQQEPVKNKVEPSEYTFLGKALIAFGAIKPEGPRGTPPKMVIPEATASYGEYMVKDVANCYFCHSEIDMKSGKIIGPPLAGKAVFGPDVFTGGRVFVSPNLTPDKETGIIADWTEDKFVERFTQGRILDGTPMPWGAFMEMNETEVKAIYRYLNSIDPVNNSVEKVMYEKEEELPK